jgi:ankyrin repeat protein
MNENDSSFINFLKNINEVHRIDIQHYFILKKKLSAFSEREKYEIIKHAIFIGHSTLIISTLIDELLDTSLLNTELYDIAIRRGRRSIILMLLFDYKIPLIDSKYFHLHRAIELSEWRIAKELLSHKMSPTQEDSNGHSPLWVAVNVQNIKCVELLLEYGAKLTPDILDLAIKKGCREIIGLLLN